MSYLFETHLHTAETSPCARVPAAEVAGAYRNAGYHGIAVTDHYSDWTLDAISEKNWRKKIRHWTRGYYAALEAAKGTGFSVIFGMELKFEHIPNDYLVYGVSPEFLEEYPRLQKMNPKTFYAFAKQHDLCVIQAHPFRHYCTPENPAFLDGLEVMNGNPRQVNHNEKALAYAEKHSLIKTAGSDYHQAEDIAAGGIYLPRLPQDSRDLARMLLGGEVLGLFEGINTPENA